MEKHLWRKIDIKGLKSNNRPCPRWGHTCCVIGDEVVFFGGYAGISLSYEDSNYMNDLWTYNQKSMEWEEVITKGAKPTNRSNCSMNYDSVNNKIVIFGGGGANKQRFNAVSVLDWQTKEWTEIVPK